MARRSFKSIKAEILEAINQIRTFGLDRKTRMRVISVLAELYLKIPDNSSVPSGENIRDLVELRDGFENLEAEFPGDSAEIIHELNAKIKLLEASAEVDAFTGFLKREAFIEFFKRRLKDHRGGICALTMADIRKFKSLNDHFGHLTGDKAILVISDLMKTHIRRMEGELFGRYGGDEFMIFMNNLHSSEEAGNVLRRFKKTCCGYDWNKELGIRGTKVQVFLDAGIITFDLGPAESREDRASELAEKIILTADQLMYEAKKSGKATMVNFVQLADIVRCWSL